jgi:threonine/homoserine/homoserine lactone efflux protein
LIIKFLGAAYLVWLGAQAIRRRKGFSVARSGSARATMSLPTAARQGFVVGFSNPKAFIIFASILPQFVERGGGQVPAQMLILGLLAFGIALVSDSVWAVVASGLAAWFNDSPKRGQLLGAIGGTSMIGLGLGVALTGDRS